MTISQAQVRRAVHNIWATLLGLEIEPAELEADDVTGPSITAAVHIHGDFVGSVRLRSSRAVIRRAGAIMFAIDEDGLDGDDERDVAGELANVIAGNLKALLPGHSSISLPTIIEGSDYAVRSLDVKSSTDTGFTLDGEAIVVTLVEEEPS
jgi:CheY-specific phosphatase CheX